MTSKVLLCNISAGTYISLALVASGQRPNSFIRYTCNSLDDFNQAVQCFLRDNDNPLLCGAAFSTSGWEINGEVDLVRYGFKLNREQLHALLNVSRIHIVNDFVAKALAIPTLKENECVVVCKGQEALDQTKAIIGPSFGFGGALLAPDDMGKWAVTHCEGGHADFAPCNSLEIDVLKLMMAKYGHVSRERAVSIPGLVELWKCLCTIDGDSEAEAEISPEEIIALAYAEDERAKKTIKLQTEIFAGTASDFAVFTGARGGIYLSGQLLDMLGDLFDHEVFTKRFQEKGRVTNYVRNIPVFLVTAEDIEIIGLSNLFD